jgi:Flp pilus assembly protein TadG
VNLSATPDSRRHWPFGHGALRHESGLYKPPPHGPRLHEPRLNGPDRPRSQRRLWREDRGALTLSYVAVLPFLFLFIMVLIQASFWFLARNAAVAAARQGADAARAVYGTRAAGPAAALAFARQAGQGYLEDPQATATGSTGTTISITVTGQVPSFVPGLVIRVSEMVQAPAEEFRS